MARKSIEKLPLKRTKGRGIKKILKYTPFLVKLKGLADRDHDGNIQAAQGPGSCQKCVTRVNLFFIRFNDNWGLSKTLSGGGFVFFGRFLGGDFYSCQPCG